MTTIFLIGFMGAGKTTVGKLLAHSIQKRHLDLDVEIEKEIGQPISQIFSEQGELCFRNIEHESLKKSMHQNAIVSTGGGIVLSASNRALLQEVSTEVIYLKTDPSVFIERLKRDTKNIRPLVTDKSVEEISAIYSPREVLYESCANFTVNTSLYSPKEVVREILTYLNKKERRI